jgi:hypothetical protein
LICVIDVMVHVPVVARAHDGTSSAAAASRTIVRMNPPFAMTLPFT